MDNKEARPARRKPRKVKVFGERNTGTRAVLKMLRNLKGVSVGFPHANQPDLEALLEKVENTCSGFALELYRDALEDERRRRLEAVNAWKHAAPVMDDSYAAWDASTLFLVRDPYSWIVSFTNRPYHTRAPKLESPEEFLCRPWMTLQRDNTAPVLNSPMCLWNEKLRAYRAFADQGAIPSTVLHFEDFVLDPVGALGRSLQTFGIDHAALAEVETATKTGGMERAERLAYYTDQRWKAKLTIKAATLVNELVDWEIARHFGYQKRDPDEFSA